MVSAMVVGVINLWSNITVADSITDSPWPCLGGNLRRTGLSPYDTSHVDGTVKWSYTTNHKIRTAPVIDQDGTIYISSSDGKLYALHPDGTHKWSLFIGWGGISSPAIGSDGTVYISSSDGKLYAFGSGDSDSDRINGDEEDNRNTVEPIIFFFESNIGIVFAIVIIVSIIALVIAIIIKRKTTIRGTKSPSQYEKEYRPRE